MTKGRPRTDEDRQLHDSLLVAAERSLHEKSHLDLTTREISRLAGTHASMINYYFGCKEELLVEVVQNMVLEADRAFAKLEADIDSIADPTHRLVSTLFNGYYGHPAALSGMIIVEIHRQNSRIKAAFEQRRGSRVYERVVGLIRRLIESGAYRNDLDPTVATLALFSLVAGPATLLPIWSSGAPEVGELDHDEWVRASSEMLDRFYR